jgi:hypothetical protein
MVRRLLVLTSLLVAACQLEPGGRCLRDPDCLAGQHCSGDVCVSDADMGDVGALCEVERDCAAWTSCSLGRCVLATGACLGNSDCPSWNSCTDHACVPLPGRCSGEQHCASWQACQAGTNRCVPNPGKCGEIEDATGIRVDASACRAWQSCNLASNTCELVPGMCGVDGDCGIAWQVCSPTNFCVPAPNRCGGDNDCDGWETCNLATHACDVNVAGGFCALDTDCPTLGDVCDPITHTCSTPPGQPTP